MTAEQELRLECYKAALSYHKTISDSFQGGWIPDEDWFNKEAERIYKYVTGMRSLSGN